MLVKIDHGSATPEVATAAGFRVVVLHDDQRRKLIDLLEQEGDSEPQEDRKRRELLAVLGATVQR